MKISFAFLANYNCQIASIKLPSLPVIYQLPVRFCCGHYRSAFRSRTFTFPPSPSYHQDLIMIIRSRSSNITATSIICPMMIITLYQSKRRRRRDKCDHCYQLVIGEQGFYRGTLQTQMAFVSPSYSVRKSEP